jgi:hypothetical protein
MKRPAFIILAVLVAAVAAYFLCYRMATRETREMMAADAGDGIAWLRQEFALDEEQMRAISALQADYEPRCMEMCARILAVNQRIEKLLPASSAMTPELKAELEEASRVQAECRAATFSQALAVSAHMAPDQAVRYRAMIAARVLPGVLPHDSATHR